MLQTIIHSTKFQILSIFLLALVLRLFYLAAIRDAPYFHTLVIDAFEYDHLATQILRGNWLLDLAEDMYVHGPLYPYLLALLKGIGFGHLGILLFQAVLGALICVLIHRVASYLFSHPIPLVAGLLAAGYWPFVFYNGQLLATTLVILVGLGLAVLLLHYAPKLTYGSAVAAGILLGLLVMGRSNTLLLLPLLLAWIYQSAGGLPKRRGHLGPNLFSDLLPHSLSLFFSQLSGPRDAHTLPGRLQLLFRHQSRSRRHPVRAPRSPIPTSRTHAFPARI